MSNSAEQTEARFAAIAKTLVRKDGVTLGAQGKKGFGSAALQVNGKIFAMVSSRGAFVVKLPKDRVEALENTGAGRKFDPGHGRLMKEWLELDPAYSEDWLALAKEALQFVAGR